MLAEPTPSDPADIIWEATLDGTWLCQVGRLSSHRGRLTVATGERTLLDEEVSLAYGAPFGPDVSDVADWETRCLAAVDAAASTAS